MKKKPTPMNFVQANFPKMLFAAFLSLSFLLGCQKEVIKSSDKIAVNGSTDARFPISFNWEDPNFNKMPYPSNQAEISVPWTGQGSLYSTVDPDVLTDRQSFDGWELVYSTFSSTSFAYNPYFILYNKYRGLMRIFMYLNNSSFGASSYLQDGITLVDNTSPMLNFAGTDIIDVSQNKSRFDKIESAPKDGSAPFATFKWYMLQYEVAYDPALVPTTSANPPQFSFYINSINVSQIKLGGTAQTKITGTIGASSPSNLFSTITSSLAKPLGTGVLSAVGSQFFKSHAKGDTANTLGLSNVIFQSISKGLTGALSAAAGNLPGAISNIFSAIIGGNSGSAGQSVSLNASTTISLSGSITDVTALPSTPSSAYIPGSIKTDAAGNYNVQDYVPLYNKPLGIFNLSNKPTVKETVTITNPIKSPVCTFNCNYVINQNSFQIQWNPAVTEIATISNLTQEVVTLNSYMWSFKNTTGRIESYSGSTIYTGKNNLIVNYIGDHDTFFDYGDVYVRISFNVVPKNGAPISTIVKTFAVNVTKTVVDKYYCPTCPK